ncbi:Protocadherin Fat 4 [Exaiptasia diaphana]|nr:Protocadherin Fat 4 [Exaiptasia diaphana]
MLETIGVKVTATFRCVITDINDNVPSFPKRLYEVSTSEATSVGVLIFSQSAVDGDATLNSNLQYSIVSGNDGGKFAIDGTGKVSISSKLDYEQQIEYTLNITVRDQPGLSNWTILVVNIADQDDLPAKFTAFNYLGSVAEDATLVSIKTSLNMISNPSLKYQFSNLV